MQDCILEMKGIAKAFSGVAALKSADLTLRRGQVMALVGENGAGKSTLMRIMTGIYDHDAGEIIYKGKKTRFHNAKESREAGIAIIHQEFNLFPNLTAAENIFLDSAQIRTRGLVNWDLMNEKAQELVDSIGGAFRVTEKAQELTVQDQQIVEIVKALAANAEILIMDEPTSALPENEVQSLFRTIRSLAKRGVAIVYVSHRLSEIFEICKDITVLRDGVTAFCAPLAECTPAGVVTRMVGKEVAVLYPKQEAKLGGTVFRAEHLSDGGTVRDLSLEVHAGEILGLYGLVGSGATECPELLFGMTRLHGGAMQLNGQAAVWGSPAQAIARGVAYVPADRHRQGIIRQLSIKINFSLAIIRRLCKGPFIEHTKEDELLAQYLKKLSVKCAGAQQAVTYLSGGNQQKIVLAKWLATKPSLLILNDPTRGVDVGAKAEIYALISQLACEGMAIVITSSEMGEILGMSDRILVLNSGRVCRAFDRGEATQETLLAAAVAEGPAGERGDGA